MADAIVRSLTALQEAARRLPLPIVLPKLRSGMSAHEFIDPIKGLRTMLEAEPIPETVIARIDQAALGILASIELTQIAAADEIDWRYDAVHMICTTAVIAARLAEQDLRKPRRR
ncbi:hypothetical protein [Nonomuraea helvata]|uniref:Uncharacterized protein n=1 Tax=Nonomuraea helvata TaxID=37484 RepID=A0ABV5SI31_9ACTN